MPFMRRSFRAAFGRPVWYWQAYANRWKRRHPEGGGGIPSGGNGTMDFSDPDASGLLALLEDI